MRTPDKTYWGCRPFLDNKRKFFTLCRTVEDTGTVQQSIVHVMRKIKIKNVRKRLILTFIYEVDLDEDLDRFRESFVKV